MKYKKYNIVSRPHIKHSNKIYFIVFNDKAFHSKRLKWQLSTYSSLKEAKEWIDNNPIKYDWRVLFWRIYQFQHYWRLRHLKLYYF